MPPIETLDLMQKAVLWEAVGTDVSGNVTVAAPVELTPLTNSGVRWVYGSKQVIGPNGEPMAIDAKVIVNRIIPERSIMWLALEQESDQTAIEQFYDFGSAGTNTGLMEVVKYNETPDIRVGSYRRSVMLRWYRDTLPNQEEG